MLSPFAFGSAKEMFIFIGAYLALLAIGSLCDYWQEKRLKKIEKG